MTRSRDIDAAFPKQSVVALQGESRQVYGFTAFPLTAAPAVAGIYLLVRPAPPEHRDTLFWAPIYIGEADDIQAQIRNSRDIIARAREFGAAHLLVRFCDRGKAARREVARDLISALAPTLDGSVHAARAA